MLFWFWWFFFLWFLTQFWFLVSVSSPSRDGLEDLDSQGDGSSQPDTISIASRTSQNTVDSDKVGCALSFLRRGVMHHGKAAVPTPLSALIDFHRTYPITFCG